MLRRVVKPLALSIFSRLPKRLPSLKNSPTLTVLTYHRVLPQQSMIARFEQPGMVVTPETLGNNIQWLKDDGYQLISLSDWPKLRNNPGRHRYAAITFDDGWRDNLTNACPLLAEHQCPATIYLVTEKLAHDSSYWPTRLGQVLCLAQSAVRDEILDCADLIAAVERVPELRFSESGSISQASDLRIDQFIEASKVHRDDELDAALKEWIAKADWPLAEPELIELADIEMLKGFPEVELGSHTNTHLRLTNKIGQEELKTEVISSKALLEDLTGTSIQSFCYPNGDFTDAAVSLVRSAYHLAVTTQAGINTAEDDLFCLKRMTMHEGVSRERGMFMARIHGWV